jgi:hypothetical protein
VTRAPDLAQGTPIMQVAFRNYSRIIIQSNTKNDFDLPVAISVSGDDFLMTRLEHANQFARKTVGNAISMTWNIKKSGLADE